MSLEHKARVQSQFGGSAQAYVASPGHAGGEDLERLIEWARKLAPARALDIATGGGHTALALAGVVRRVVAADLTGAMLTAARQFIRGRGMENVEFVGGDVEQLPFKDESFDLVTCRIAPHHFPEVLLAVRQVARVLKPGGSFLLQDILGHDDPELAALLTELERRRDPTHVRAYRKAEWETFLRGAGLTVIEEAIVKKVREWDEWCSRTRVTAEVKAELEQYVKGAPARFRKAFAFRIETGRVLAFTDRHLLIRAEKG